MAEQLTTYTEDFTVMRERLLAQGAGNTAVAGTVTDGDVSFRAAYHVDETQEPPVISQLLMAPAGTIGSLMRITVKDDEPHMAGTQHQLMAGVDAALQMEMFLMGDDLPELKPGADKELPFTYAYDYVQGFEPDASAPVSD